MKKPTLLTAIAVAACAVPASAQYQSYGVSFSNPVTAQMNTDVNSGIGSRLVYRMILKKHGYKDPELGQMKTEEMYNLIQSGNYGPQGEEGQKPTPQAIVQTVVPDKPASRFSPSGTRALLPEMVKLLTDKKEYQDALLEVFETGITEFEKEAAKHDMVNDVAGAIAFFIGCAYTVCKDGEEPSTDGLVLVARALQLQFNTEEFRRIPDADKQRFYELMVALGTYLVATRQTAIETKDDGLAETIKKAATETMKGYLKLDPAKFKITANGVEIASGGAADDTTEVARTDSEPEPASTGPLGEISFPTPAGWQRSDGNGVQIVERVEDLGFGQKAVYRLVIASPRRIKGSQVAAFQSIWNEFASVMFEGPIRPLPLRVRLKGGGTLIYDGAEVLWKSTRQRNLGFIYVVMRGDVAVPIVGNFSGWEQNLDRSLREVFDGLRVGGAAGSVTPLFDRKELPGRWRSSTTSIANWVDAAGNYRGDASIATGETLALNADGTYRCQFAAIGGGGRLRSDSSGPFTVEDDTLVLKASGEKDARYRIIGVGRTADGKGHFLILGITRDDFPSLSAGSTQSRSGDAYVSITD